MTANTKLGLILALVFIIVITFVINGLPQFLEKKKPSPQATIEDVTRPCPNTVSNSRRIAQIINEKPIVSVNEPSDQSPAGEIRFATPGSIDQQVADAVAEAIRNETAQQTSNVAQNIPQTQTLIQSHPGMFESPSEPAKQVAINMRTYEVQNGDTLASIAKKMYGAELGNKKTTIDGIFKANTDQLSTPHEIQIGQKLSIPDIAPAAVPANKKSVPGKEIALVREHSNLLESIKDSTVHLTPLNRTGDTAVIKAIQPVQPAAQEPAKTAKIAPAAAEKTIKTPSAAVKPANQKTYVVKNGDNLWRIAMRLLGDGKRYKEIIKANPSIDPDNIAVGTTIVIPAR